MVQFVTFVIGAGGSLPYGFPTWRDLGQKLTHESMIENYENAGFKGDLIYVFRDWVRAAGGPTIDEVLAYNKQFKKIAHFGIAYVISQSENQNDLMEDEDSERWYGKFFEVLFGDLRHRHNTPQLILDRWREQIRIVSFNYDRSLEVYIWNRLARNYGCGDVKTTQSFRQRQFHHPYGRIGGCPWEKGNSLPYKPADPMTIKVRNGEMRTVDPSGGSRTEARQYIDESTQVFFLGFGFHPANMKLLGIHDRSPNPSSMEILMGQIDMKRKVCIGTGFGLKQQLVNDLSRKGIKLLDRTISKLLDDVKIDWQQ